MRKSRLEIADGRVGTIARLMIFDLQQPDIRVVLALLGKQLIRAFFIIRSEFTDLAPHFVAVEVKGLLENGDAVGKAVHLQDHPSPVGVAFGDDKTWHAGSKALAQVGFNPKAGFQSCLHERCYGGL